MSLGQGVMVGGTRPSGPCCPSPGPGEGTAPTARPHSDSAPQSLWHRLAFLTLRIPRKAPGGPGRLDQRRPSRVRLCPPRPPPSGSLPGFLLGAGGQPSHLGWNRGLPFQWSLQGRGKPLWALDGSFGAFCPSEENCVLDTARQGGHQSAKAPGTGSCPVERTETAQLGTMPPAALGRFQSIRWPQKQGLRLEPQRLPRPEAALTAGNLSPPGGDCDDQGRPTLPAGGMDHVSGSRAPELWRPPGASRSCGHVPPLDSTPPSLPSWGPRPPRWAFPVASGWGGRERAVSCSGRSQQPGKNLPTEKVCFITFLPFVLAAPRTGPGPGPSQVSLSAEPPVGTLTLRGPGVLTPHPWGLTLASPWPHLRFTDTHILEAKATREERLNGSRLRTL